MSPGGFIARHFHLWRFLKASAVLTIVLVIYSMAAEAYSISNAFIWVAEKIINLTWGQPSQTVDHYRVEISETDLLADPVVTSMSYTYARKNQLNYEMLPDHSYYFRVQSVNPYGVVSGYSDSTSLYIYKGGQASEKLAETGPVEFALSQNYPNPFNSHTSINYQVPGSGGMVETNMVIYNILGQKVRELVRANMPPGEYSVIWDGMDESGREVSSGHYIYRLTAGKFTTSKKMIMMK
jgi:hypothetical protein